MEAIMFVFEDGESLVGVEFVAGEVIIENEMVRLAVDEALCRIGVPDLKTVGDMIGDYLGLTLVASKARRL